MWPDTVRRPDLRIEFMRGSGKGGQNKNKRDTACRITHVPTGIAVRAEDERTQELNKKLAFKRLCEKLIPLMKNKKEKERVIEEEVRVYRAIDERVRDKRIKKQFSYKGVLEGNELEEIHEEILWTKAKGNK